MADIPCILMGIADILAGILIFLAFGTNIFGVIFGLIMITKGGISFV